MKPSRLILTVVFLSTILISCGSVQQPEQQRLNEIVLQYNIPGINVSVIHANGHQESWSAGYADTLLKTDLNAEHVLFSGSIGKTYAVAVLMQLVEEGKVDLDKKFLDYFPETEWLTRLPNMEDITTRMLLQHVSGLPRYINAQSVWDSLQANPDKVWTYKERFSFIFDAEPLHAANEGWAYSDTNYLLIGMLIEKITGNYYYDEVEERLLNPLKLEGTHPSIRRDLPNLTNGYCQLPPFFRMPGTMVENGLYAFNPQMEWTGGGMASTTPDLARWAKAYYTAEVFSEASLQQITTPNKNAQQFRNGDAYGMGSFIYNTKLGKAYGHTGFVPGFNALFAYFPDKEMAVAVQVNCDCVESKILLINIVEEILAEKN